MRSLIIGASSGLGRSLAYNLASKGCDLIISSSDKSDLIPISKHLTYLYKVRVDCIEADAGNSGLFSKILLTKIINYDDIEYVFFPMGISFDDDNIRIDNHRASELININFQSIVLVCNFILTNKKFSRLKTIVGFGSIATARSRKTNILYTAAKCALKSYFQSIRHSCSDRVNIQFYEPGYLISQQSIYKKLILKPTSSDKFAELIFNKIDKKFGVRFYPFYWYIIARIIQKMPWFIFKKLNF